MNTGYGILFSLIIVAVTSYLRNTIPYEIFYYVHHLVFAMFAITIAHTMDDKFRGGQERSQTFKWFSASLVLYFTDRFYMYFKSGSHEVVEWRALDDMSSGKFVVVKIRKPLNFVFRPGQYVFLKCGEIDFTWHPFSIASAPSEKSLEFYIEVVREKSWTGRLFNLVVSNPDAVGKGRRKGQGRKTARDKVFFNVIGPYGSGQHDIHPMQSEYEHMVAIGAGTGVVPMVSLMKSVFGELQALSGQQHLEKLSKHDDLKREFSRQLTTKPERSIWSVFKSASVGVAPPTRKHLVNIPLCFQRAQLRYRIRHLKKEGQQSLTFKALTQKQQKATLEEVAKLLLLLLPFFELTMLGLNVSWSSLPSGVITSGMSAALQIGNIVAVALFLVFFCSTTIGTASWWIDLVDIAVSAVCIFLWTTSKECIQQDTGNVTENDELAEDCEQSLAFGKFDEWQRWAFVFLSLWRILRVWLFVVLPGTTRSRSVRQLHSVSGKGNSSVLESFKFVFISRDPALIALFWDELDHQWVQLSAAWGKYATRFASIEVYCTSKDLGALQCLQRKVDSTALGQSGALHVGRPDAKEMARDLLFSQIVKDKMIGEGAPSFSSTLFAVCGGTRLGHVFHEATVATNAMAKLVENQSEHNFDFEQENYGQDTPPKPNTLRFRRLSQYVVESNTAPSASTPSTPDIRMSISDFLKKRRECRVQGAAGASRSGTSARPLIETARNISLSRQVDHPPQVGIFS